MKILARSTRLGSLELPLGMAIRIEESEKLTRHVAIEAPHCVTKETTVSWSYSNQFTVDDILADRELIRTVCARYGLRRPKPTHWDCTEYLS